MRILWYQLIIFLITLNSNKLFSQDDFKIYNKARKLTYKRKWDKAIESYEKLKDKYPDSRYKDDADFWTAYILEKEGKSVDAFTSYQQLIRNYPHSPWVDDAMIHQILLAETLVRQGENNYVEFLKEKLDYKDKNVRYQAALSLGKIGNKIALPVLKEIVTDGDEDLSALAKSTIDNIDKVSAVSILDQKIHKTSDIDILIQAKKEGGLSEQAKKGFWDKLFFKTKRYKTYKHLNKKGDKWTDMELITYGLWHILPEDQFDAFFSLSDDYDKREWLRKFWKDWDPTPTTTENERKEEFIRRIHYARAKFGQEWNLRQAKYLTEQYLRSGWSMAPWDSRGELYIKYGEPDFRDISHGFMIEEWTYYRYNVDFLVRPYVTNIFGNGIQEGPMSKIMHKLEPSYVDAEFIFKPDFKFDVYRDFELLKNFKLNLYVRENKQNEKIVDVSYILSGKEFKFEKFHDQYRGKIRQSYVVLDEDLKDVVGDQKELELIAKSKEETDQRDNFKFSFEFNIPPGYYTLAIRIKDLNSNKLGIFHKELKLE